MTAQGVERPRSRDAHTLVFRPVDGQTFPSHREGEELVTIVVDHGMIDTVGHACRVLIAHGDRRGRIQEDDLQVPDALPGSDAGRHLSLEPGGCLTAVQQPGHLGREDAAATVADQGDVPLGLVVGEESQDVVGDLFGPAGVGRAIEFEVVVVARVRRLARPVHLHDVDHRPGRVQLPGHVSGEAVLPGLQAITAIRAAHRTRIESLSQNEQGRTNVVIRPVVQEGGVVVIDVRQRRTGHERPGGIELTFLENAIVGVIYLDGGTVDPDVSVGELLDDTPAAVSMHRRDRLAEGVSLSGGEVDLSHRPRDGQIVRVGNERHAGAAELNPVGSGAAVDPSALKDRIGNQDRVGSAQAGDLQRRDRRACDGCLGGIADRDGDALDGDVRPVLTNVNDVGQLRSLDPQDAAGQARRQRTGQQLPALQRLDVRAHRVAAGSHEAGQLLRRQNFHGRQIGDGDTQWVGRGHRWYSPGKASIAERDRASMINRYTRTLPPTTSRSVSAGHPLSDNLALPCGKKRLDPSRDRFDRQRVRLYNGRNDNGGRILMTPRHVILANPDSKRWLAYEPELRAFWHARGIEADVELVPWSDVVPRAGNLDGLVAFDRPAIVRLESPGRDWHVARQLLALGTGDDTFLSLPFQKGKLVEPLAFFEGFRRTLAGLDASFRARPHLHVLADPLAIVEMFDKNATCRRLRQAGLPIPGTLDPPPGPGEVLDAIRATRWRTAYAKLNTGSSASAIVVVSNGPEPTGQSSVVSLADGFFSSRRLASYRGPELVRVLDFLGQQGLCVQEGIRMATVEGRNFDVRVVCVHGKPTVTIFRLSWLPMTNLHLGGQRGDWQVCRAAIPTRAWLDALDHCEAAASLYRGETVGIDLLFEAGFHRHFILEMNAFGDFFPGLVDSNGRSIAALELEETARRAGL